MPEYPPGHAWHLAVFIPTTFELDRLIDQTPFLTIPDDLIGLPDWALGLVLEVQEHLCMKCRKPYRDGAYDEVCEADSNPEHLRGGKRDRAWRHHAPEGQSAAEVASRRRLENPALMQRSRTMTF